MMSEIFFAIFVLILGFIILNSGYILLSWLNALHREGGLNQDNYIKTFIKNPIIPGFCIFGFHFYVSMFVHDGCIPGPDTVLGIHQSNFALLFLLEFLVFFCVGMILVLSNIKEDSSLNNSKKSAQKKWIFRFWQFICVALCGVIFGQFIGSIIRNW
jgi:hypothetical protein